MNVKLLRKVKQHILEEPRRYWQTHWLKKVREEEMAHGPACGTTGCLAGWTYILGKKIDPLTLTAERAYKLGIQEVVLREARTMLGLTGEQADRLFASGVANYIYGEEGWPAKFWDRYRKAKRPATRAKIAAERIEHFIKTKGKE